METPRKFIIAELSIRKLGSSSVLIILALIISIRIFISANYTSINSIINTDEDPSLRIESSAIINLRGVSTKLNNYIVFTMQAYKKLKLKFFNNKVYSKFFLNAPRYTDLKIKFYI